MLAVLVAHVRNFNTPRDLAPPLFYRAYIEKIWETGDEGTFNTSQAFPCFMRETLKKMGRPVCFTRETSEGLVRG